MQAGTLRFPPYSRIIILNLVTIFFAYFYHWSIGSVVISYLFNSITVVVLAIVEFFYVLFVRKCALMSTFRSRVRPPRTKRAFVEDFIGMTLGFCFGYAVLILFLQSVYRSNINKSVFIFAAIYFISQTISTVTRIRADVAENKILSEEALFLVPYSYLLTLSLIFLFVVPFKIAIIVLALISVADICAEVLKTKYRYAK